MSLAPQLVARVTSSSDPGTVYVVTLMADGSWKCTCPAFRHGSRADGGCKHIDQVRETHERAVTAARVLGELAVKAQGRCAGCQETGELRKIEWHVAGCGKWAHLYRTSPGAALAPAQEYSRWREQERQDENAAGLQQRVADTQAQRAASVARFEVDDPLED